MPRRAKFAIWLNGRATRQREIGPGSLKRTSSKQDPFAIRECPAFTDLQFSGAHDALAEYWASIGGKPIAGEKPQKKRGRQSSSIKPDPETKTKKQRSTKGARSKDNGRLKQDVNPPPTVGFAEVGDDGWTPPLVKDGSWDPLVQSVDTVVRENSDGELWGYLIWNEQNASGRYYRSKAKLPAIYKACPQRMLHFYERHLYEPVSSVVLVICWLTIETVSSPMAIPQGVSLRLIR